jgi:hypothetical protein
LRTRGGQISKPCSREELDEHIREYQLTGTVGAIYFEPLFDVEAIIHVPWEDGLLRYAERKLTGPSDSPSETEEDSALRSEDAGVAAEARADTTSDSAKPRKAERLLRANGASRP